MAQLIGKPETIPAEGTKTKLIQEYVGRVNTATPEVSIAVMESPSGWSEPGQTPEFDEYSIVLDGELHVELRDSELDVRKGQAVLVSAGEWVRYSTPRADGARYVSVCLPAFSPDTVHRDGEDR